MPKRFNLSTVYRKDEYGNPVAVPALMGGGSSDVDLSDITDQIDGKTEKKLLTYDGTAIHDPNGNVLTFETLHRWLMDDPYFVVLVYDNYAYHPNGVSDEQIVFASSYPVDGYVQTHRITLLASGTVTQSSGASEIAASRVSTINDSNKDSTKQYTSVKAVTDYVADAIDAQESSLKDELKANTRADDSRWAMAEGSVWTSHTETVTAAEIPVPENAIGVRVMGVDGLTAVVDGAFFNHTPARIGTMDIGAIVQQYFPTGMRSMGELADVLDFENQQATINIGQYICDGSENWRATNDGYYFEMPGKMRGTNTAINAQYADMRTYGTSDRVGVFGVAGTYQTVSSWKAHLTQEPLVIHYILATPVVAPMDTMPAIEQSVEQGAALTIVNDQNAAVAPPVTLKWYERVAAAVSEENVKTALGISADDNVATKRDFTQLDAQINGNSGTPPQTIDITSDFVFTDGGGIAVNNIIPDGKVATPSGVFCYSNFTDISEYAGAKMRIAFSVYTASNGSAPAFGLCIYGEDENVVLAKQIQYGTRQIKAEEIEIPNNARYIRTTFFIADKSEFFCEIHKDGIYAEDGIAFRPYTDGNIFFDVLASAFDGNGVQTECVLKLPSTYKPTGTPTPVVMIGHGSKGMVSNPYWYNDFPDFLSFVDTLVYNGFAVFDVDNVDKNHVSTENCFEYGCPQLINSYHKAYEYIKSHYNVERTCVVYGMSQGSFVAWNYPMFYRSDVKGCVITGVRVGLEWLWNIYGNVSLAQKFGYSSPAYNAEYLKPFDIYTNVVDGKLTVPFVPCELFYGGSDTIGMENNRIIENALKSSGYYCRSHTYSGIDHHGITQPTDSQIISDILRFIRMLS